MGERCSRARRRAAAPSPRARRLRRRRRRRWRRRRHRRRRCPRELGRYRRPGAARARRRRSWRRRRAARAPEKGRDRLESSVFTTPNCGRSRGTFFENVRSPIYRHLEVRKLETTLEETVPRPFPSPVVDGHRPRRRRRRGRREGAVAARARAFRGAIDELAGRRAEGAPFHRSAEERGEPKIGGRASSGARARDRALRRSRPFSDPGAPRVLLGGRRVRVVEPPARIPRIPDNRLKIPST